jgi:hypothetical protein
MPAIPDPALTEGLKQIMTAVDRVKMSIEVQKLIANVQSGCEAFNRVLQKNLDIAKDTWNVARTLGGLNEIEDKVNAESAKPDHLLVAYKELQQVLKCAAELETNLADNNQGKVKTAYEGITRNLNSASSACRDWNEAELTKIRVITYKLLNS